MKGVPARVLWAWESPQDLRFLEGGTGVAFLAGELHQAAGRVDWRARRNPLRVHEGTPLVAVLRIEAKDAALGEELARELLRRTAETVREPGVVAFQIDFDATTAQRAWYAEALARVREALPPSLPLSITALGSWCFGDPWIRDLPVDEAVPMLFRMGPDELKLRGLLARGEDVRVDLARHSYGVSTDEPMPRLRPGRRVYVFHPGPWTREAWIRIRGSLD